MKKVLVLSHASVLEVNRDIFYNLALQFDVDLRIVCPLRWRGDLIRDLRCQENSRYPEVPVVGLPVALAGNGSLFFYRRSLKNIFPGWGPDTVFVDEEPWSLACLQAYGAFPRAELLFYTKQNLKKKLPFPFGLIQGSVFRRSAFCLSVTDEVSEVLQWKGFRGPIRIFPHSFDARRFRPIEADRRASLREELGLATDSCVVGYFGRLDPEKGIDDLCAAIELLERKGTRGIEVLIVGNGSQAGKLDEFLRSSRKIKVVKRAAIPHDLVGQTLAAIDVLVLPSRTVKNWKEQFGRILVEAMGCGAAVVGSDSGEIPHLIRRSGAGLVFAERDPAELAARIEELVLDREKLAAFRQRGYAYASGTLTHEKVARELGAILGARSRSSP